jgi:hypothetical protein
MIEGSGSVPRTNGPGRSKNIRILRIRTAAKVKFMVVCWVDEASPTWHADAAVSPALVNARALVLAGVALALVDVRLAPRPREPLRNRAQIYVRYHTVHAVLLMGLDHQMDMAFVDIG